MEHCHSWLNSTGLLAKIRYLLDLILSFSNKNSMPQLSHNLILANFIRSSVRTWKIWMVQASPWCVEPCSGGLDLQELRKISTLESKGGPHWKNEFTEVPPLVHRQKNFFSSWRSTPLEHGSTHHGEAWTIQIFHVVTFDLIKLAKIGLWY